MLGVQQSDVRQVAGNDTTGFFRADAALPYRELDGTGVAVEAYSWGNLTSGLAGFLGWLRRALWLLLLPFALANLAYWARLRIDGSGTSRAGAKLTRLGALLLTVFMILIPAIVGDDLIAWQCYRGGSPGCTKLPGLLDFIAALEPAQRLVVASILPLAFIGLLWMLSGQSLARYEAVGSHAARRRKGSTGDRLLQHPPLWDGADRARHLRRLHIATALTVIVLFPGLNVLATAADGIDVLLAIVLAIVLALGMLAAVGVMLVHRDDIEAHQHKPLALPEWVLRGSAGSAVVLRGAAGAAVAAFALMWLRPPDLDEHADFYGHNIWFIGVFVALTVVHLAVYTHERVSPVWSIAISGVVVALAAWAMVAHAEPEPAKHRVFVCALIGSGTLLVIGLVGLQWAAMRKHRQQAWGGAGASVMLAGAAWVALVFTTGAVTATANFLNGSDHSVGDLVSVLGDNEDSRATDAVVDDANGDTLAATGEVVIEDAVVTFDAANHPVLRRGTIRSERLFDINQARLRTKNGVALQKGRVDLRHGTVLLDAPRIRLRDSCINPADPTACSAETDHFLVGGTLVLPTPAADTSAALRVDSVEHHSVQIAPALPPEVPIVVPQVLIWAPLAQALWLVGVVGIVLVAWIRFRRARPAIDQLASAEIAGPNAEVAKSARRRAAFAHKAERLIDAIGGLTAVLAIALIGFSATGQAPWVDFKLLRPYATIGMYLALALGLGLIALAARIRNSEGIRKGVGILWDLTTFWPRAAHPLAPPCYAERVVPELVARVDWALDPTGGAADRVVLSGHSQGSAITCAVLSRFSDDDLARLRVITYGSQIRALYGRVFPAVFGPDQIGYLPTPGEPEFGSAFPDVPGETSAEGEAPWAPWPGSLAQRLAVAGGGWVNLFRRTDPLGFRVFSDADVAPDRYTSEISRPADIGSPIEGHGGYQHSHEYREAIAEWTGEVVVEPSPGVVGVPALPT